jgi:hypothetical protein
MDHGRDARLVLETAGDGPRIHLAHCTQRGQETGLLG